VFVCLVPFVKAIVPVVDMEGRRVYVDPPPGLLELAVEKEVKIVVKGSLPKESSVAVLQGTHDATRGDGDGEAGDDDDLDASPARRGDV
jgi:hypothetical protein